MNGEDFVKLCFEEKKNTLKQYFNENDETEVGKRINALIHNGANRNALYELINLILKENYYTLLLALDGEASLGGKQVNYKLLDDDMNTLNECGELEGAAYKYFIEG
ncbi:hypothetical protein F1B92_03055 [Campylobacter sp. FMV-PI01]|uniref:Uncharacterized protein n=1 Tax=Campylobacter portucalensis TaxID=2608384 RepID=A0A6L5WI84_9BACT|nr:hypothetical protein [Campylobacter portucalensis]MSN96182.1 hypothetical protein [Campylobacter portucalensis]